MPYTKHTWADGEVISKEKLNNIETGVEAVDTGKVNMPAAMVHPDRFCRPMVTALLRG